MDLISRQAEIIFALRQRGDRMDLISRQAEIDYFVTNVGWNDTDGSPVEDSDELRELWTDLFNGVPSAQPETCAYWDRESNICALHRPSAQPAGLLEQHIDEILQARRKGKEFRFYVDGRVFAVRELVQ